MAQDTILAPALMLLTSSLPALLGFIGALWLTRALREHHCQAPPLEEEAASFEPEEVAYLRGGMVGLVRYHLSNLTARGWLERCDERGATLTASPGASCYRAARHHPSARLLRGAAQEIWIILLDEQGLLVESMHLQELTQRLSPFGEAIHRQLARAGVLLSYERFAVHRKRVSLLQKGVLLLGAIISLAIWPTSHTLSLFEAALTLLTVGTLQTRHHIRHAHTSEGHAALTHFERRYEPLKRTPWRWKSISSRDRDFLLAIHSSR